MYGITQEKMEKNLKKYCSVLSKHGIKSTIPITAVVLKRHINLMKKFQGFGIEFSIHGFTHEDMLALNSVEQKNQIEKAIKIFKKNSIPFYGFRAPYLRSNNTTKKILNNFGLYDSSDTVFWDVLDPKLIKGSEDLFQKILNLYKPKQYSSLPRIYNGCISIPVSIPDDELLIDRLNIRNQKIIFNVWKKILDKAYARGEMFVIQLHPEKIGLCDKALEMLLEDILKRKPRIAILTLKEVAEWWKKRNDLKIKARWPNKARSTFCVTGDIDSITIWDYVLRLFGR